MSEEEARATLWREGLAAWGNTKLARRKIGFYLKKANGNALQCLLALRYAIAGERAGLFEGDVTPIILDQIKQLPIAPKFDHRVWASVLLAYRCTKRWDWSYGPEPGYQGCQVPLAMLNMTRQQLWDLKGVAKKQHSVAKQQQLSMF